MDHFATHDVQPRNMYNENRAIIFYFTYDLVGKLPNQINMSLCLFLNFFLFFSLFMLIRMCDDDYSSHNSRNSNHNKREDRKISSKFHQDHLPVNSTEIMLFNFRDHQRLELNSSQVNNFSRSNNNCHNALRSHSNR